MRTDGQWLRIHKPVFSLKARNQNPFRANRLRPGHTAQTDPPLYAPTQRQSRTQPPGRSKALLRFPSLLLSHRLWWAASCPPKSQQLSSHASSSMAFSFSDSFLFPCPIYSRICDNLLRPSKKSNPAFGIVAESGFYSIFHHCILYFISPSARKTAVPFPRSGSSAARVLPRSGAAPRRFRRPAAR